VQTGKITKFPIVLVGSGYWAGLVSWIRGSLLAEGKISPNDPELLHVADDPAEVAAIIKDAHNHQGAGAFP
jgi:predicted Rossmann-fold nucleotide-binding protein